MKNIQLLENLYESALSKRKEAREGIIKNEDRIREIDRFLNSAKDVEEDIRFFTPRKLDEIFGDRVQSETAERAMLIERNENLFNIVNDFDQQISQLKEVIDELKAIDVPITDTSTAESEVPALESGSTDCASEVELEVPVSEAVPTDSVSKIGLEVPASEAVPTDSILEIGSEVPTSEVESIASVSETDVEVKAFYERNISGLNELQSRLELISSFLLFDGQRAKLELDETIDKLSEIIQNVSHENF